MLRPLLLLFATMVGLNASEKFRQVLTSASRGISLEHWELTAQDLDPQAAGNWSIRKTVLRGGKQEGVDLITVDNGRLVVTLIPTRGMGLLEARMGEVRLGWDSPVKEVVHPKFINLESRGGLGWLEGFNEMMVRCGLEFAGHPGQDTFINNVGDQAEMDLTLHGKIGNIPASEVEVVVNEDGLLRVHGRVDERMFYGPKLELWTELATMPGSESFTLHDRIQNHSAHEQEFQLIYHANFGTGLLEEGARFMAPIERVVGFNAHAAKDAERYQLYPAPTKGFIEQVYCLFPYSGSDGQTTIMLQDREGGRAVSMRYSTRELPYLTLWKNTSALEEGYVTGLEPGTGFPFNRSIERKAGRVPKLRPGETREFHLRFTIHDQPESVQVAAEEIRRISGDRRTRIDREPLAKPEP